MVDEETLTQKTTTSLLLGRIRIVTHFERVQCVSVMCCLWRWMDSCSNPPTSFTRQISQDLLPKLDELWTPRLKKEDDNTSALLLTPETWLQFLYHQAIWTLPTNIYLGPIHFSPNFQPPSYIQQSPSLTWNTINSKQLSPTFALSLFTPFSTRQSE